MAVIVLIAAVYLLYCALARGQKGFAMKLGQMKNDVKLETDGVWMEYAAGVTLKIARSNNPKFEEYLRELLKPQRKRLEKGTADEDLLAEKQKKAMARHVLLDWKGIEDEKGKPLPYSEKKAFEIFMDPEFKDFYREVKEMSEDRSNFQASDLEDEAKN